MILALCLLSASTGLLLLGPRLLVRMTGPHCRPLVAIVACQVCSWGVLAAATAAAGLIASPWLAAHVGLPASLESCLRGLHIIQPADSPVLQTVSAAVLAALVLRVGVCSVWISSANHRRRSRHRSLLQLVAEHDCELDVDVIEHPDALVYCVPGRGGRVVFTSSALQRLSYPQRVAVLAHERAHLRGRHDRVITGAALLRRAFPRAALFSLTHQHLARLIEMRADDVAAHRHGPRPLAEALLALAMRPGPAGTLAASAVTTSERVERLLRGPATRDHPKRYLASVTATVLSAGAFVTSPALLVFAGHAALCA